MIERLRRCVEAAARRGRSAAALGQFALRLTDSSIRLSTLTKRKPTGMGSKQEEYVRREIRLSLLRQLEATVAAKEPVDVRLLAAIRELLMEAEAEQ